MVKKYGRQERKNEFNRAYVLEICSEKEIKLNIKCQKPFKTGFKILSFECKLKHKAFLYQIN
jgi:hypothetical protein